jgi:hypothetical protein
VEGVGRQLFATALGACADARPIVANSYGLPEDNYWSDNEVSFPAAWPEKATLPVHTHDPQHLANRLKLLAYDEVVLAFWRCRISQSDVKQGVENGWERSGHGTERAELDSRSFGEWGKWGRSAEEVQGGLAIGRRRPAVCQSVGDGQCRGSRLG